MTQRSSMHANVRPYIPFLVFWVGTRCTLRCRDCCNLIPYLEQRSFDSRRQIAAMKALLRHCSIGKLQIQGGEPFTHPDIDFMIHALARHRFAELEIATNGTVPLRQRTIDVLYMHPEIRLRISNYSCAEHRRERFLHQCATYGLNHSMYNFMYGTEEWFHSGGIHESYDADDNHVQDMYARCENKNCHTLYDGVLHICGKIPAIRAVYGDGRARPFEEVDLTVPDEKTLARSLHSFLDHQSLFALACRYCRGTDRRIRPAVQISDEETQGENAL